MSKKLRNRFIALVILAAFVGGGFLLYYNWVVQKPFAIILFISEGMNVPTLTATRIYEGGATHRLTLESLPHVALLSNYSEDYAVSDPAAAATALATGTKTTSGALGVDLRGQQLKTIANLAKAEGRTVGLVTNTALTDTTPAAFYAHTTDTHNHLELAQALVDSDGIDVFLGGGKADFLPELKGGRRHDGIDLILELRNRGYDIIRNEAELENTPTWKPPQVFGAFTNGNFAYSSEADANSTVPTLNEMVRKAIQLLEFNPRGYLLIVDSGLVEKAARENQAETVLQEMLAFDETVQTALEYAGENALILATGDVSIGGLRLNASPFRDDKGVSLTGTNPDGLPWFTWSTGPAGPAPDGEANPQQPAAAYATTAEPVAEDQVAVGVGPGSEALNGFQDNTKIFSIIRENL